MEKIVKFWIISKAFDVVTTVLAVGPDFEGELNPLVRFYLQKFGISSLLFLLIFSSVMVYFTVKYFSFSKLVMGAVKFGIMVNLSVGFLNLFGILLFLTII